MSQHDFVIDNQNAPASRADINNALQALASLSSGTTAPVATYANMLWYDTVNDTLKIRNEANSAWISLGAVDQTNNVFNPNFLPATQAEAEAGSDNIKGMTPLRVKQAVAVLGGISSVNIQVITATGTYTPTSGYKFGIAFLTNGGQGGGNGSGGSSGNGGDAGATSIGLVDMTAPRAVTIGAGGSSGGGGGGSSSLAGFTSLLTSSGGQSASGPNFTNIVGGSSFWGKGKGSGGNGYLGNGSSGSGSGAAGQAGVLLVMEFK